MRRLFLSALLLLLVVGCARRETPVEAGIRTQTLHLGNGAEPQSLDPHLVTALTDANIMLALFEGLCALDERTSEPLPAAAARWEVSADGLVYTFHLRENLKWSNGDPLVAGDFVFAWRRALSPALAAEYAYLLFPLKNAAALNAGELTDFTQLGAEAVDDRTLRLTLAQPTPYLPALTVNPVWFPLNPRVVAAGGAPDQRSNTWSRPESHVGNGPFALHEWRANAHVSVRRNPHYWDAAAMRLNTLVFHPVESPETEERNFRAGQLHITHGLPVTKIAPYRADQTAALRIDPFLQTIFLRFNTTRPPFDRAEVRRAFALAIDRAAITGSVLRGANRPAPHFTPPDLAGYTARATVGTDAAEARRLLAAAGFPEGRGLPVITLQVRSDALQPAMAEVLQAQWQRELGVRTEITILEQRTWIQNQQALDYMVSGAGWIGDFADPLTFLDLFVGGGGNNWTGWHDPAYDALIAAATAETDPTARLEFFQQAEALLLEAAPMTPVFFGTKIHLVHPSVRGWEPALLGFHRYKHLYLEP
ncbi:MAG: peptide ABC transporter substrate-binding protein [Opitutaceae bacterium]|nr:peptide ABC transporter substrate-binding protein [Opitutaceae bacterium]